mmetsp:Transcript_14213/g.28087  ORF Transcript_14213/g.28087 Transcript_14213/m.28087 type:complete len:350 (+) Transcript_14213:70-1119(+)
MSLADCIRREKGTKDPSEVDTLCLDQAKCTEGLAPLAPFLNLASLSIQDAGISSLDGLPALDNVTELKMSDNKIKGGLENLLRLPNLERLYLAGNQIGTFEALEKLAGLAKLELLDLEGNPVTKLDGYQSKVFNMFDTLIALDGKNRDGEEIEDEDDDDEDDDKPAPQTQAREVTFKTGDKTCEKHPTWKQCRQAAKKTGGSSKNPLVTMDNGLEYKEITYGKGNIPQPGDTVTVHYSLFYNGDEIESSRESSGLAAAPLGFQFGITSGAGSVIPAINEGITGMKVGGVRRVIAPPELAFGARGKKPRIPGDATVEFDLQLLTVKRAGTNPISSQGRGSEKNTGLFDLF